MNQTDIVVCFFILCGLVVATIFAAILFSPWFWAVSGLFWFALAGVSTQMVRGAG